MSVQTVKQSAASAVLNRIPASADVMIWTVMNMQRSVKIMRLIDADELIEYIKAFEIGTSISSDQKEFIDCVNNQPTAFDVNKVVEQLEMLIEDKVSESGDDWYTAQCLNEASEIVEDEEKVKDAVNLVRTFAKKPDRTALTESFIKSLKLLADTVESQMKEVK